MAGSLGRAPEVMEPRIFTVKRGSDFWFLPCGITPGRPALSTLVILQAICSAFLETANTALEFWLDFYPKKSTLALFTPELMNGFTPLCAYGPMETMPALTPAHT